MNILAGAGAASTFNTRTVRQKAGFAASDAQRAKVQIEGTEKETEERVMLAAQRRTKDHIIVSGSPATATSSLGASAGIFRHVQPYPTRLSQDEDPKTTAAGQKVLCCSGASQFPGLLATGGMGQTVKLWIHRPLDDEATVVVSTPA